MSSTGGGIVVHHLCLKSVKISGTTEELASLAASLPDGNELKSSIEQALAETQD